MAILKVCAVFDSKAEAFNRPLFVPAIGVAERSFSDEVNRVDSDNPLYSHSADFVLYYLGTYDEQSAAFDTLLVPQRLGDGVSFKRLEV